MIYQIENKYYIRVAPMKYTEIKFSLREDEVVIITTQKRIITSTDTKITEINFKEEKEKIRASLLEKPNTETVRGSKYRRRG